MQKSFTLLALLFVLFTSCRKQQVTNVTEVTDPAIAINYTIKPSDWITEDESVSYTASREIPQLTNDIYNKGAVIAYIAFGTQYYEALPEVFDGIAYGAIHSPGFLSIDFHALDGQLVGPPSKPASVKVVLIPATTMKAHPDVNLKNFNEVQKAFLDKH